MSTDSERPISPDAGATHDDLTPLDEGDQLTKDLSYSPGSERETAVKQVDGEPAALDDDIDRDAIQVTPGTGGPDDVGEVDVDPDDLNLPWTRDAD